MNMFNKGIWIWHINAIKADDGKDVCQTIIDRMVNYGIDYALIKAGDATRNSQWTYETAVEFISRFHSAGLKIGCWSYNKPSTWQSELQYIVPCIKEGIDLWVLDPEIEYQNDPNGSQTATTFGRVLRSGAGSNFPIFYAPFAFPQMHQPFPYKSFNEFCNGVMPQLYHCEMNYSIDKAISLCEKGWIEFNNQNPDCIVPVLPICNTYGFPYQNIKGTLTKEDLLTFMNHYSNGFSCYSWDASVGFPQFWEALAEFKTLDQITPPQPIINLPIVLINDNVVIPSPTKKPSLFSNIIAFILSLFRKN